MKFLKGYLPYLDCKVFRNYLDSNPNGVPGEANSEGSVDRPLGERIGGVAKGIREFHANRAYSYAEAGKQFARVLSLLGLQYVSNNAELVIPKGAIWMGVVYLTSIGEDYNGEVDVYGDLALAPEIGDVIVLPVDLSYTFGTVDSGETKKLIIYWQAG